MIEAAERAGTLRHGGTIVEPTSGNTGVGLALAAVRKGYRCIFVMPDKVSQEKIRLLRAYGAEVVVCPTAVAPESAESYYSVSNRLAEEIPGAFKPDQYSNPANPQAHYETTGPELWEQTGGEIDALVLTVGTGGTITGVGSLPARAEAGPARRRRRSRGLDLLVAERSPVPRRGHRRGLLAVHVRSVGRRRVRDRRRPRLVPHRAASGPRGGNPRRRLGRNGGLRGAAGRQALRRRLHGRHPDPRLRAWLPLEALRRQLARAARHPPGLGRRADGRGGAGLQGRRRAGDARSSCSSAPTGRSARRSTSCSATASPRSRWCGTTRPSRSRT